MSNSLVGPLSSQVDRRHALFLTRLIAFLAAVTGMPAFAQITCTRTLTADVVAFDQPIMYNRLGAANVNGMMYALKRDVVDAAGVPLSIGGAAAPGAVSLRPDTRPRPLVLRGSAGDCLTVNFTNLLAPAANPRNTVAGTPPFNIPLDEQVKSRFASFHANGMQLVDTIDSDGSNAGKNPSSLAVPFGASKTYKLYAEKEGVYIVHSYGATVGSDGNEGQISNSLFGQVIVEPKGAKSYRGLLTEEEMRLATTGRTPTGHPIIDYEATFPSQEPWISEGKAGLPILNMVQLGQIVHSELEALNVGPNADGSFPPSTYPLESKTYRNPTVPNRLEPFRDFASVFHDETANAQAFPGFYLDPVFKYVLAGVKDAFMINYGSGGIGSEIIANRLGVGPMHDCLDCSYEEFFLTSFTVGDPALLVDVPANVGLEGCTPAQAAAGECAAATGPKANFALYPNDPINVHHSYIGDFVKIRNTHIGKEQHVFHLHNHQWLYNPNDDNSNYLDAQGVGPGVGYTYEINFGGSGNRNKSAGDAIFHCHFYPHFAQGMWYHWRHYDTFEAGTLLQASVGGVAVTGKPGTFHATRWAQQSGAPAAAADAIAMGFAPPRAHPDGELVVGVPLVAIVPLPGKPMAPIPAQATVVPNLQIIPAGRPGAGRPVGSLAQVTRELDADGKVKNPGYPFWIAGIEDIVGQRPPTPVLDMLTTAQATALKSATNPDGDPVLFEKLIAAQADGWDGGLPRHALKGYVAGGATEVNVVTPRDFTKVLAKAAPVYYPEGGTDLERAAMRFHKKGSHPTTIAGSADTPATFITNGVGPVVGAPYHEPCRDDNGKQLVAGVTGNFFSGEAGTANVSVNASANLGGKSVTGRSVFNATTPRIYRGANIQFDAILNKVGYHYPQQRIITLWEDAMPVINKLQPPEPLVMRLNTFDCAIYAHTNLVPEYFEMDDFQVRTPTDIIGQHIHLPKWDLTTTDGSANGWNYEDGTHSPGAIRERIRAINEHNLELVCNNELPILPPATASSGTTPTPMVCPAGTAQAIAALPGTATVTVPALVAAAHPYFGQFGRIDWLGARTTMQRWFADPVVNTEGVDRGLGIIFTHDHYGPSTHQQIGLYATVLAEPAGSKWVHNETGTQLGCTAANNPAKPVGPPAINTTPCRYDGGPTSWQAAILTPSANPAGVNTNPQTVGAYREFYFEFSDFQHAYEAGAYVGADQFGVPIDPIGTLFDPGIGMPADGLNPRINRTNGVALTDSFRVAINPPARQQIVPLYPDLVVELAGGAIPGCPARPCPQAISVSDPGMFVVNYRNEPVALRIFDPVKLGPDGKPGAQADGIPGDLSFALASYQRKPDGTIIPITRKIAALNRTEQELGIWTKTLNAPTATLGGDPFTPMMRSYEGDPVRVKIQAGGHEEEHSASMLGLKWLQAGSGYGKAPNSGWRGSQAAGISEQFTFSTPLVPVPREAIGEKDYGYNIDSSMDGWWSGTWGILRSYESARADLYALPSNPTPSRSRITNRTDFVGVCPASAPLFTGDVIAILANDLLPNSAGVTIAPAGVTGQHAGGALNLSGGTLVYNPRNTVIPQVTLPADVPGEPPIVIGGGAGPLHDPTAIMYVRATDVVPVNPKLAACQNNTARPGVANPACPIKLKAGQKIEPLILRVRAGNCLEVTLFNRVPEVAPDLPTLGNLLGVVKRDRNGLAGSVPFDNNLIRPSSHVGLTPQLVALDTTKDLGTNIGINVEQTVAPPIAGKVNKQKYRWYAGDLRDTDPLPGSVKVAATPVEFGGFSLA
ncbi:MAG: hypothetical protein WBC37_02315, partial [Burkholderiaceae bacterium]